MRPKDVCERLGISTATLRLWSTRFESHLSPSARASLTANGSPAQRRYTEDDLAVFVRAKSLLATGLTYDQTGIALANEGGDLDHPIGVDPPVAIAPTSKDARELAAHPADRRFSVAVVPVYENALQALRETVSARDQAIAAKDETITALKALARMQEELIAELRLPKASPVGPVDPVKRKFDFGDWWRMLTGTEEGRRTEPAGSAQRPVPQQDGA